MDIFIILYKVRESMKITTKLGIIVTVIVIIFTIFSGCTSDTGPTQASANQISSPTQTLSTSHASTAKITVTQTTAQPMGDFSVVTHMDVSTIKAHWTSGAEDDGITVHPNLLDAKGQTVMWSGVSLPVTIEIYSTKFDANYKQVKDQLVYKGSGTISSWKDGNMFMGGGIQVPFSEMNVPAGQNYGWTYATVTLPNGQSYSGKYEMTALTA